MAAEPSPVSVSNFEQIRPTQFVDDCDITDLSVAFIGDRETDCAPALVRGSHHD